MVCMNPAEPEGKPLISLEQLEKSIPSFDWAKGHSGALLSDEVEAKLDELWEEV